MDSVSQLTPRSTNRFQIGRRRLEVFDYLKEPHLHARPKHLKSIERLKEN